MGKDIQFLSTKNIKICGRITKLEAIRLECNMLAVSSISAAYLQKFEFLISQGCSNMPKVRWAVSNRFCSKFHNLYSSAKILKIG